MKDSSTSSPSRSAKSGRSSSPEDFRASGIGLQEVVVEELVDEHGVVVCAEVVVAAACKWVVSGAAKTVPKLVETGLVLI